MKPRTDLDDTQTSDRGGAPGRDQAATGDAQTLPPGGEADAAGVLVDRAAPDDLPVISKSNYDFGRAIATGGMGRIFAARDRRLDRPVAIKELLVHTDALRRRFDREVRISARLQHPAIVNVLAAGQWPSGDPFYAMKLVAGRSLAEVIAERRTLAERMALLPHVIAAADALAYAHEQKIIHRDLKPANVLVGDFGETVVIDWGLAKDMGASEPDVPAGPYRAAASDGKTMAGAIIGTPAYMPPEQARGEAVDQRADVYALGALLYHVLAGVAPFAGESSKAILTAVLSRPPVPLEERQQGVPPDLLAVVAKAMALAPADRDRDAGLLAADLKRFQTGQLVSAHEYTGAELAARWFRRHRAVSVLAGAALVAVAVIAALSFRRVRHEQTRAEHAAADASARANALVLRQAESLLASDPTRAVAWLKTYSEGGDDWARVRALADDAQSRGVARHVLRHNIRNENQATPRQGGKSVISFEGTVELRTWDVASGTSSARCLSVPRIIGGDLDSMAGAWILHGGRDGSLTAWQPETDERELVSVQSDLYNADISRDGRWVAIASELGEVRLVDRALNRELPFAWLEDRVDDVDLLEGGARLIITGGVGRLELWDVARGVPLYSGPPGLGRYVVSPDDRFVAWTSGAGVIWMDLHTLALAYLAAEPAIYDSISFFPDGRVLIADKKRGAIIWEPRQGESTVYPLVVAGTTAVSSDGRLVASGTADGKIRVMDVGDGSLETLSGHEGIAIVQVAFMPGDRELLSSGADGTVRLWPVGHPAERIWRLDPLNQKKPQLALRDDGKLMVASAPDGTLWKRALPEGTPERLRRSPRPVTQVIFLHDGAHLLVADAGGELSRWSLADGTREVIARDLPYLTRLLVTRDDRRAVGVSFHQSETWIWDLGTGKGELISDGSGDFRLAFLSPDERYLGIDSVLDEVHTGGLYELATGKRIPLAPAMKPLTVQGFSPSSRYVFSTQPDGTVTRQDLTTGARVSYPIGRDLISSGVALADGIFMTGSKDEVRVWLPDLGLAPVFDRPGPMTNVLDRSPSGRRVIAQTTEVFFVWDLVTGERRALRGHHGGYALERWASDDLVVTSTSDGTVRLWPLDAMAPRTPRETLAWLDQLTTFRLEDMNRREPDCR
jgi:WD40 repeat protein